MATKPKGGDLDLDFHSLGVSACLLAAPLRDPPDFTTQIQAPARQRNK